jgi:hypothetical protein
VLQNHGAEVARKQTMFGQIDGERHLIEFLNHLDDFLSDTR